MQRDMYKFVSEWVVCQQQKYMAKSPTGLLQPLPIHEAIWKDMAMDFITGLPKSRGYEIIMAVVDRLTKSAHFLLLKHPLSAKAVAEVVTKEVIRLHGIPKSIVSNRVSIFISHFWTELFWLQQTKLRMRLAYHPETNGQTEVFNRCLETYLWCFV